MSDFFNGNGNGWRKWVVGALTAGIMMLAGAGIRHTLARIDVNEAAWKDIARSRDERTATIAEFRAAIAELRAELRYVATEQARRTSRIDRLEEELRMRRSR